VEAERLFAQALELYTEVGAADGIANVSTHLARVAWRLGDEVRAEKLLRESIRMLAPLEDRGTLCESQRILAQLLLARGKIDEAEKLALAARETVGPADQVSRATTRVALGEVYAARGRDAEAEELFLEALDLASKSEFRRIDLDVLPPYIQFLRERGREDEAAELDARVAEVTALSAA
jgi:ATP/maltotriose-dependent transcriptional regulator MalT